MRLLAKLIEWIGVCFPLVASVHGKRTIRHAIYDTNWWKSFIHARLAVAFGDRGCLSLFGNNPEAHRMLSEQLTAEYYVKTEGRGRTVDEWKSRSDQPDNHWLDCLVGAAMAASMQGCVCLELTVVATSNEMIA